MSQHKGLGLTPQKSARHRLKGIEKALGHWPCALFGMKPPRRRAPGEEEVCNRIVLLLRKAGFTHARLADAIGVSRAAVSQSLAGSRSLPRAWLPQIAAALGTSREELLRGVEWKPGRRKRDGPRPKREERKEELALRTRLRQLFREHNLTQDQVAAAIGVTRPAVSAVLTGVRALPPPWLKVLASLLNMTVPKMLQGIAWEPRKRAVRKNRRRA